MDKEYLDTVRISGYDSYYDAVPLTHNPFQHGTVEHMAWRDGWGEAAERHRRQVLLIGSVNSFSVGAFGLLVALLLIVIFSLILS